MSLDVRTAPRSSPALADPRRVPEHVRTRTARRAIVVDQRELLACEMLREFEWIADGRGRRDELRLRAVVPAHAQQPAEQMSRVRAEQPRIRVHLVDHDVAQMCEEPRPARVLREDARVEHVGVADDDPRRLADAGAGRRGRVPVVGPGLERRPCLAGW